MLAHNSTIHYINTRTTNYLMRLPCPCWIPSNAKHIGECEECKTCGNSCYADCCPSNSNLHSSSSLTYLNRSAISRTTHWQLSRYTVNIYAFRHFTNLQLSQLSAAHLRFKPTLFSPCNSNDLLKVCQRVPGTCSACLNLVLRQHAIYNCSVCN